MVFTGHRIDAADREKLRFPAAAEDRARELIREALERELALAGSRLEGLAGAASGGDILFHELAEELGVPTEVYLAREPDRYERASVADAGTGWVERYRALLGRRPVRVLGPSTESPGEPPAAAASDWERANRWMLRAALASGAERVTLLALWDGQPGDGPGGTEHMIEQARKEGARTVILDAKELAAE